MQKTKNFQNNDVSKLLGKQVAAPRIYDRNILVREERKTNRDWIGLGDMLPFVGYDVWNAWECSTLAPNGCPMSFILKIVYPASSKYIVESKSLKLYLHSFNMTKLPLGGNYPPGVLIYDMCDIVQRDLSDLLETSVQVYPYSADRNVEYHHSSLTINNCMWENIDWAAFKTGREVNFDVYREDRTLLKPKTEFIDVFNSTAKYNGKEGLHPSESVQYLYSTLLRSNCKITHQPDNGDVYVYMKGDTAVDEVSLLKYIVSFRDESHFHEEVSECIYHRLWTQFKPKELLVFTLYVRRGGIDINPIRASEERLIPKDLIAEGAPHFKTRRQ